MMIINTKSYIRLFLQIFFRFKQSITRFINISCLYGFRGIELAYRQIAIQYLSIIIIEVALLKIALLEHNFSDLLSNIVLYAL